MVHSSNLSAWLLTEATGCLGEEGLTGTRPCLATSSGEDRAVGRKGGLWVPERANPEGGSTVLIF